MIRIEFLPVIVESAAGLVDAFIQIDRFNRDHRKEQRRKIFTRSHALREAIRHMFKRSQRRFFHEDMSIDAALHPAIAEFERFLKKLLLSTREVIIKTPLRHIAAFQQFRQSQPIVALFRKNAFCLRKNQCLFVQRLIRFVCHVPHSHDIIIQKNTGIGNRLQHFLR